MDRPSKTSGTDSALQRIGWLFLIWVCSVAALGALALVIRMLMKLASLTG